MKLNLYIFFLFFFTKTILAQKHDNIWVLGGNGGQSPILDMTIIDFSFKDSAIIYSPKNKGRLRFNFTCASICDKTGKLAFYSNGYRVENWAYDTIPTKGHLARVSSNGGPIGQGVLILPFPQKDSLYLMLYEEVGVLPDPVELGVGAIFYGIIDMSKNNGRGGVIEIKKVVPKVPDEYYPCIGKLCAIRQANGIDWWIYTMKNRSNVFYRYALTKDGFSFVDTQIYGKPVVDGVGMANFSPNGKYHARYNDVSVKDGHYLDVYDFDRCTGKFSNQRSLKYNREVHGSGVAFSPNSRYLYVALGEQVVQYDMEAANFAASERVISHLDTAKVCGHNTIDFYNCQLAPNNKIYINSTGCTKMHVIEKPDLPDTLCQLRQRSIILPTFIDYSMPTFPNFNIGKADCKINVQDIDNEEITIYPNPAQETLYIDYKDSALANMELKIINIAGQLIATHNLLSPKSTIDVSGFANGVYYCVFRANSKMFFTKRLVIIK